MNSGLAAITPASWRQPRQVRGALGISHEVAAKVSLGVSPRLPWPVSAPGLSGAVLAFPLQVQEAFGSIGQAEAVI